MKKRKKIYTKKQKRCRRSHKEKMQNKWTLMRQAPDMSLKLPINYLL